LSPSLTSTCGRHAQVALGRCLLDDAGRLQQKNKRARAAIHDGQFGTGDVDIQIVDAEAGQRRHQMFDSGHAGRVDLQCGRQPRIADVGRERRNGIRARKVSALEYDAGVRRRRTQRHLDSCAGVHAYAGGFGRLLQGALLEHRR
jgi:hypothetical protein